MRGKPTTIAIAFFAISICALTNQAHGQEPEKTTEQPTLIVIGAKSEIETRFAREAWEELTEQIRREITEIELQSSKKEERMEGTIRVTSYTSVFLCEQCGDFHLCKGNRISIQRNYDKDDVGWDDPRMVFKIQEAAICAHLGKLPDHALEEWRAIAGDVYDAEDWKFHRYDTEEHAKASHEEWDSYPKNGLLHIFALPSFKHDIRFFAEWPYLDEYCQRQRPGAHDNGSLGVDWSDPRYMQKFTWLLTWGFYTEEQYLEIKQYQEKK